ncbi:lipoprotein-anchoring transpeptidase ErfK/SrfK [Naumannella cuiyingiana]|uniref:Lipoprotein-anchoring transpeptidase ErfK/SrfK n=1 Tax=Naumannella cuiyingiana TaxID=1347891 RepID=A0A7Z0IJL5_9ACTN|nr:lipoprotein-anchoring transpeptidase ErfK/SrfK [Naumannella cuiyingiana]
MSQADRRWRRWLAAPIALIAVAAAGCGPESAGGPADDTRPTPVASAPVDTTAAPTPTPEPGPAAAKLNVADGAKRVKVDTVLKVEAAPGTRIESVRIEHGNGDAKGKQDGPVAGELADDGATWEASEGLDPGEKYRATLKLSGADGESVEQRSQFSTAELTLDDQVYPETATSDGETYGVGMPIQITFDLPVKDRAAVEKRLRVTAEPAQQGSWHWFSDTVVRYRPETYWKAGSKIKLDAYLNGVSVGGGRYGQQSVHEKFNIGKNVVEKVDLRKHTLQYIEDGKVTKTLPISAGKEGFTTRSGIKVISEKSDSRQMNSETVSIYGSEAYNLKVQWAMRITNSGEFLHAAPWNAGNMGETNASHGCTGLDTDDAYWLYERSPIGTPVEYTGSDSETDPDNGYGDWNLSFADYRKGSAL